VVGTIDSALLLFKPISLEEMEGVRLMNRIDTKYVLPVVMLTDLLNSISRQYMTLIVESRNRSRYRTLYFDSPDFRFYHDHHNGRRPRYKARFREYTETGTVFFEVKQKNNKNRTIKNRIVVDRIPGIIEGPSLDFMHRHIPDPPKGLQPSVWSTFSRITLVSNNVRERVTIDLELGFFDDQGSVDLPHVAVAEIKRDSGTGPSYISDVLTSQKVFPVNLSKYCTGVTYLKDRIKYIIN